MGLYLRLAVEMSHSGLRRSDSVGGAVYEMPDTDFFRDIGDTAAEGNLLFIGDIVNCALPRARLHAKNTIYAAHRCSDRVRIAKIAASQLGPARRQRHSMRMTDIANERFDAPPMGQQRIGDRAALLSGCAEDQDFPCAVHRAASSINSATAFGWETMTTCDAPFTTTVRLEPARLAINPSASAGIFLSASP